MTTNITIRPNLKQKLSRTAERIIDKTLPTLQELYLSRVRKRAGEITLTPQIQHTPL